MWLDFTQLEEVNVLFKETEQRWSAVWSLGEKKGAWGPTSHLCVCGRASAGVTAWSISCCSRDTRTQTGAFLCLLTTSHLEDRYQKPVEHPWEGGERGFHSGEVHWVCENMLTSTDLESSEDTVCVYVVLGTNQHRWRRGYGVAAIAVCMSTVGQEQNYKW